MEQAMSNDIRKVFQAEYYNGLQGFPLIGEDYLQLAKVRTLMEEEDKINELRQKSGSETLTVVHWLGHAFLKIKWYEHSKIPIVFKSISEMGEPIWTCNKLKIHIPANCEIPYTIESVEKRAIERFHEDFKRWSNWHDRTTVSGLEHIFYICIDSNSLREWNWYSEEGKRFCKHLKEDIKFVEKFPYDTSRYLWDGYSETCKTAGLGPWSYGNEPVEPIFADAQSADAQSADAQSADPQKSADEPNICMLCEENTANTMVLPCMHTVVCSECSEKLCQTGYSQKCVACTVTITEVHQDGVPVVFK